MNDDLDDTVVVVPRAAPPAPLGVDLDDTVIRRPDAVDRPAVVAAPTEPGPAAAPRGGIHSFTVDGQTYSLDTPAIVGRKPRGPRVPSGESIALITVRSAASEVSSSHVEVRQRGTSVIVTDLRSTNGSSVSIPLSQPRRLRQGESIVVSPGSLIDIGDGNIIRILPLAADSRQEGSRD